MYMVRIAITPLLLSAAPIVPAQDDASERPQAVTAYEECAVRVFSYSDQLSDVLEQCEAEMAAFTRHLNDAVSDRIEQQKKAETERNLRARKDASNENQ